MAREVDANSLIPLAELHSRMAELPRDECVYVSCASGNRSYTAAGGLAAAGIDAVSVAGGTRAWAAWGWPVVYGADADESAA